MEDPRTLLPKLFLVFWCVSNIVCGSILKPHDFPAIYNFGDSNSATGNFGFQPPPPNAPNRICDGHIIIDYIGNK